jgi:hypothetical protein
MEPNINIKRLFSINKGRNWPVVRGNAAINRVQKILKNNHVTGIPTHWPKIYYGQSREHLAQNRTYRNTNVGTLPDGAYLYLIEYNPSTNRYHKNFVRVLNKLEAGSRHFQLPILDQNRIIVAAGELSKSGTRVTFNLESGTYTKNLMTITKNYMNKDDYIKLVKNALRSSQPLNYTSNILVPQIPGTIKNLLNRGNVSFYFGEPSNKTKARVLANLKKAGLTTNSAENLIRQLMKNSGAVKATPKNFKRPRNNAGPRQAPLRRSGRSAARS